ncbi:MAG TPA: 4-hydroxy-tetrahydrodipicolinate synthase [Candidatus Saccharimonadales bacterium]|nr:4-hydroxy-tetrahydrodipicolinate synthase [Candidatus Saccharimonadales bacterium]
MKDIDSYKVWTAVITPMNDDGSVDYESFEKILRQQDEVQNAVAVLASTGEGLNLDDDEKKRMLEFAIGLNLSVPIMTAVGANNLNTQLEWVRYLNTLDLDCYLVVVPVYAKPGVHGQYGWFKALLDAADKPCMLYNIPGRTAKKLEFQTVKMLKGHKNLWAMKEASGSEEEFAEYIKTVPDVLMLSGDDLMLPPFSRLGAKGVVSVAANVWPQATKLYAEQCASGSFKDDELWESAIKALFCASNPVPVKALMHDKGMIKSGQVRLPLSTDDMPDIDIVRQADKLIKEWFIKQTAN